MTLPHDTKVTKMPYFLGLDPEIDHISGLWQHFGNTSGVITTLSQE